MPSNNNNNNNNNSSNNVESWDDDLDFQGDLFTHSVSTVQTSFSSRVSTRSESLAGDEDWQVLLTPNDDLSTQRAIDSAKEAGIPIPKTVPPSALLGGSIKRLGKKSSRPKVQIGEDWGDDLDLPEQMGGLKLRTPQLPKTPAEDQDDFDDWGEGSLGIRHAGTRRGDGGHRSSSISAISPSLGSCMTVESEDDDFTGLVLPTEPVDFNARLRKLKEKDQEDAQPTSHPLQPQEQQLPQTPPQPLLPDQRSEKKSENVVEDFLDGLDIGDDLDTKKHTLNRNVKINSSRAQTPLPRPATTLTFTDKPSSSRIPRLLSSGKPNKLDPVYESGAPQAPKHRAAPTTRHDQLLRLKRSAPALRSHTPSTQHARNPLPFIPGGASRAQSHHAASKASNHYRRDSDPARAHSPSMRSYSRLSGHGNVPDTPSRTTTSRSGMRKDIAPAALAREAASKRLFTKPAKRRAFGDGSELDAFDDLPTSATKEHKFVKTPANRTPVQKTLRHTTSSARLPMPDRNQTPAPPATPRSPTRPLENSTPRFARDTAASRIAREQRLAGTRSRAEGQTPATHTTHTNWKAHVAAHSPHNSPVQKRKGTGQKPHLIKPMSTPIVKNEKGMVYNPILHRWEGNDTALNTFNLANQSNTSLASAAPIPTGQASNPFLQQLISAPHGTLHPGVIFPPRQSSPTSHSPPRPALISQMSTARNQVQVERGMVFDPLRMKWLKISSHRQSDASNPDASPSVEDEEDPFAGLEDLKDETTQPHSTKNSLGPGELQPAIEDTAFVSEEFDLGPEFIRRQTDEEKIWRKRTEGWVGSQRESLGDGWRWSVRDLARLAAEAAINQAEASSSTTTGPYGTIKGLRRMESFRKSEW
ncbi:hypothetical protein EJ05DRAFT_488149 [Pseudovirgaria hyperparasitica]|uniref:Cytokinesis regulator n=1 Tax=Pseudovirgaria hyperparasitica TaxID=470096 RepID=A0A6A6W0B4_9PEZI|nr:uncharacterized protein EJ05DRAFT_488149 [Pseudovirgaria hyperparasitica]KAF2755370.1 hypothetical protein EJ05DRAFT_488149 [Pseudovirgaria hyperparasitica]